MAVDVVAGISTTTPPPEEQPSGAYATYVPHDLPYNRDFEDALMHAVLAGASSSSDSQGVGVRIIPDASSEQAISGISVRAADVSLHSLPVIAEDELPLPLNDPRRVFASAVPAVKLTHPAGYLEGGPGLHPDMDTFPEDFLSNSPHISTPEQLHELVSREIATSVELLKERLLARQRATEKNAQLQKDLERMLEAHSMESKVQRRLADERRAKKEAKERRRMEREAG